MPIPNELALTIALLAIGMTAGAIMSIWRVQE